MGRLLLQSQALLCQAASGGSDSWKMRYFCEHMYQLLCPAASGGSGSWKITSFCENMYQLLCPAASGGSEYWKMTSFCENMYQLLCPAVRIWKNDIFFWTHVLVAVTGPAGENLEKWRLFKKTCTSCCWVLPPTGENPEKWHLFVSIQGIQKHFDILDFNIFVKGQKPVRES